ncbi:hypothetical protein PCANC_19596, partial [Puccinia coronata f. sp. avenae]
PEPFFPLSPLLPPTYCPWEYFLLIPHFPSVLAPLLMSSVKPPNHPTTVSCVFKATSCQGRYKIRHMSPCSARFRWHNKPPVSKGTVPSLATHRFLQTAQGEREKLPAQLDHFPATSIAPVATRISKLIERTEVLDNNSELISPFDSPNPAHTTSLSRSFHSTLINFPFFQTLVSSQSHSTPQSPRQPRTERPILLLGK